MKLPVYSYSFLNTYDTCPKQSFHRYVLKDIPKQQTEQMKWGDTVHKGFEERLGKGTPLPAELARYEPYAVTLEPFKPQVEMRLGIDKAGNACAFFDDRVWLRGKADVAIRQGSVALLLDWKTGKRREDGYELEIQSLMLRAAWPDVERVTGRYVWLQDNTIGKAHDVTRTNETFEALQEKTDEIEHGFKTGYWPTKQGPLCGWCPVLSCGFNRVGK